MAAHLPKEALTVPHPAATTTEASSPLTNNHQCNISRGTLPLRDNIPRDNTKMTGATVVEGLPLVAFAPVSWVRSLAAAVLTVCSRRCSCRKKHPIWME